jgi:hypothetical protein
MSSYPLILLPVALQRALREEPMVPEFNEPVPKPPTYQEPQPINIQGTIISATILVVVVIVLVQFSLWAVLLLILGAAVIFIRARLQSQRYQIRLQDYDRTMEHYYARLTEFSARASQHQHLVNRALSPASLASFRASLAEEVLRGFHPEAVIATNFAIDDGVVRGSDCVSKVKDLLAQYFFHYFGAAIQTDVILMPSQLDDPFVIDFVYRDRTINLYIAIVIDVPYDFNTKTALNYADAWQDRLTAQALQENGWILLRFTEEQVWRLPKSCCRELAKLVATVSYKPEIMVDFQHIGELPRVRQWNKRQVEQLAIEGYREQYLASGTNKNSDHAGDSEHS